MRITGVKPAFIRPPYGSYNDLVRRVAAIHGQQLVTWEFDSGDSKGLMAGQIKQAYTNLGNRRPLNVLTLNHEIFGAFASLLFGL